MDLVVYLLFAFIFFGAPGVLIGQRKGRAFAGFVWGMLLGPIGWLIVWLGPDLRQSSPAPLQSRASSRTAR
jgi:hypothetical protein